MLNRAARETGIEADTKEWHHFEYLDVCHTYVDTCGQTGCFEAVPFTLLHPWYQGWTNLFKGALYKFRKHELFTCFQKSCTSSEFVELPSLDSHWAPKPVGPPLAPLNEGRPGTNGPLAYRCIWGYSQVWCQNSGLCVAHNYSQLFLWNSFDHMEITVAIAVVYLRGDSQRSQGPSHFNNRYAQAAA